MVSIPGRWRAHVARLVLSIVFAIVFLTSPGGPGDRALAS